MKQNFRILTLLSATALTVLSVLSCNKVAGGAEPAPYDAVTRASEEIVFTAGGDLFDASVQTKAGTSAVTSLSSFNVLCVKGTAGSSESAVFNSSFSGSTNYTGGKYWPSTDQSYKFYAANESMTTAASGPTIAAANSKDIVCAFLASPTYRSSNKLTFNHIFARIGTCNITAPSTYTVSNLKVTVTPKTGGTYALFAGNGKTDGTGWSETATGSAVTLASALNSSADNNLYLVPGSYTLTATYTLTKGDYTEAFSKTSTVSLVGGKINNISATLPQGNAAEIVFTVSVTAWSNNSIEAQFS